MLISIKTHFNSTHTTMNPLFSGEICDTNNLGQSLINILVERKADQFLKIWQSQLFLLTSDINISGYFPSYLSSSSPKDHDILFSGSVVLDRGI